MHFTVEKDAYITFIAFAYIIPNGLTRKAKAKTISQALG